MDDFNRIKDLSLEELLKLDQVNENPQIWKYFIKRDYNKEYGNQYSVRHYFYDTQYVVRNYGDTYAKQRYFEIKEIVDAFSNNHILLESALDMLLEVFPSEIYHELLTTKIFNESNIITIEVIKNCAFEVLDTMDSLRADQYYNEPFYNDDYLHNYIVDYYNKKYTEKLALKVNDNLDSLIKFISKPTINYVCKKSQVFDYDYELFQQLIEVLPDNNFITDHEQIIIDCYLSKL